MTSFEKRLSKAVERGQQRGADLAREERQKALTEEELRKLHTAYRLQLSEHIEQNMKQLPNHFPGFLYETMYGERGWGGACSRNDVGLGSDRRRASFFSRLEMTIRPYSDLHVVELAAKGTIRNREIINRTHFELIGEVDTDTFINLIDAWILEYAELYAARD